MEYEHRSELEGFLLENADETGYVTKQQLFSRFTRSQALFTYLSMLDAQGFITLHLHDDDILGLLVNDTLAGRKQLHDDWIKSLGN